MNRFTVIMIVLAIGLIGFIAVNRNDPIEAGQPSSHVQGEGTSGVTLLEYGDFQCAACAQYYPVINAVKEAYGDEISFQYRHFPIINIHPNAIASHRAAEAAGKQGKFFEMHDLLFERQESWSESTSASQIFDGYASELELNMDQYREDYGSSETLATINADRNLGEADQVTGTPSFYINGQKIDNPRDPEAFFEIIDAAILEETGEPSQNSPRTNSDNVDEGELPEGVDLSDIVPTEESETE